MKSGAILLVFLVLYLSCGILATKRLVQVQVLNRHCDRVSTRAFSDIWGKIPSDPVNLAKILKVKPGSLTPLGQRQCYILGTKLREKYNGQIEGFTFDQGYNPAQMEFHASYTQRTLRTQWSAALGLMPTGRTVDVSIAPNITKDEPALPHHSESVPIAMVPWKNDIYLNAFNHCPKAKTRLQRYFKSKEYKELSAKHASQLSDVEAWTGWKGLTLENFYHVNDLITVQHSHGQIHKQEILRNLDVIHQLGDISHYFRHARKNLGKGGAGPLVEAILEYQKLAMEEYNKNQDDGDFIRFREWSAHDSTIQAAFSTLMMDVDHEELRTIPPYGSALAWELWVEEDEKDPKKNNFFVRISYLKGYNGQFQVLTAPTLGCKEDFCPFSTWDEGTAEYSIPSNWCDECGNSDVDICVLQKLKSVEGLNVAFYILIPLFSLAIVILLLSSVGFAFAFISQRRLYQMEKRRNDGYTNVDGEEDL